jgi:malonate decarboxylase delta subunit
MERLVFELDSAAAPAARAAPVVVGVVSSGNLEVLVEPAAAAERCHVEVATSAVGFAEIWRAVLEDFAVRHAVGGLALSVNDGGATPAVVTLRLGQAVEEYLGSGG